MDPSKLLPLSKLAAQHLAGRLFVEKDQIPYETFQKIEPLITEAESWSKLLKNLDLSKPQTIVETAMKVARRISAPEPKPRISGVHHWCLRKSRIHQARKLPLHECLLAELLPSLEDPEVVIADEKEEVLRYSLCDGESLYLARSLGKWEASRDLLGSSQLLRPASPKKWGREQEALVKIYWEHLQGSVVGVFKEEGRELTLTPMSEEVRPYSGPLEGLTDELRLFWEAGVRRTVLIHGLPGSGKTTMCRWIAEQMEAERILFFPNKTIRDILSSEWTDLIALLQPQIILIDDIDYVKDQLTWLLNQFADQHYKVALTLMTANFYKDIPIAFKRPGRIDRAYEMLHPDKDRKERLVQDLAALSGIDSIPTPYLPLLCSMFEGPITGAYIQEIFRTVKVLGWENTRLLEQDSTFSKVDPKIRAKWNALATGDGGLTDG